MENPIVVMEEEEEAEKRVGDNNNTNTPSEEEEENDVDLAGEEEEEDGHHHHHHHDHHAHAHAHLVPGEGVASPLALVKEDPASSSSSFGCSHYKRKCKFYTPCCQKTYRCRFCHDNEESHVLQREDVLEVVCSSCGTRQKVRSACEDCGTVFGKYFCFECKLYDDEDKEQFHCDGCGICRIGGRKNFFHCEKCDMCLPSHLNGKHRCIENLSRANCPICQEDIHTSREPSQIPPCNHLIHKSCFDQLVRSGHFFCPVCAQSLVDMRDMWTLYDQQIAETPLPTIYQNLFSEIYCRDCLKISNSSFHIVGIKCPHCAGYNTVREKGPLLRKVGQRYEEANLLEDEAMTPTDDDDNDPSTSSSSPGGETSSSSGSSSSSSSASSLMSTATTTFDPRSPLSPASPDEEEDEDEDVEEEEDVVDESSVQEVRPMSTTTMQESTEDWEVEIAPSSSSSSDQTKEED